jgi:hypothetical protein
MTPFDFWVVLRNAFVVPSDSPQEAAVTAAGRAAAAALNEYERSSGGEEAVAVAGCEHMLDGWPGWGAGDDRVPLFVVAHGFNAWNHHEDVWRHMRTIPVTFTPIPAPDLELLNDWLFRRYRFPKARDRFEAALRDAAAGSNRPRRQIAEGMLEGFRNADRLAAVVKRAAWG